MRSDLENMQLEFMYLDTMGEQHACPVLEQESGRLLKKLNTFGDELTSYEDSKDFGSVFSELKNTYHFLQIRTWMLQERMKRQCNSDKLIVLYFYSKNCDDCKNQGFIISYFKQNLEDRLMVFALDTDWDQPMMNAIKADLNITSAPSIIIGNGKYGFLTKEQLGETLCNEYQQKPDICNTTAGTTMA